MKEKLLREIARIHKGIKVWEFSQTFGRMSVAQLQSYVTLAKAVLTLRNAARRVKQ